MKKSVNAVNETKVVKAVKEVNSLESLKNSLDFVLSINGSDSPLAIELAKAIKQEEQKAIKKDLEKDLEASALASRKEEVISLVETSDLSNKEQESLLNLLDKEDSYKNYDRVVEAVKVVEEERESLSQRKALAREEAAKARKLRAADNIAKVEALKEASIKRKEAEEEELRNIRSTLLFAVNNSDDLYKEITGGIYFDEIIVKCCSIGIDGREYKVSFSTKDLYSSVLTRAIKTIGYDPSEVLISLAIADDKSLRNAFKDDFATLGVQDDNLYVKRQFGDRVMFCNMTSDEKIAEKEFKGIVYNFLMSSPSAMKAGQWYMIDSRVPLDELIDQITFGGLSSYKGKNMSINKLVKEASGRESQSIPASLNFGQFSSIAFYTGKLVNDRIDGVSYLNANQIRTMMSETLGKAVSMKAVLGNVYQFRNERSKTHGPALMEKAFLGLIQELAEKSAKVVVETFDNPSHRMSHDYDNDTLVILVNDEKYVNMYNEEGIDSIAKMPIGSFSDFNAIKSAWELKRGSELNVLASNNGSLGANTSVQILEKAFAYDSGKASIILENIMNRSTEKLWDGLFTSEVEDVNIGLISQDKLFVEGIVNKLAPIAKSQDLSLLNSLSQSLGKDLNRRFNKAKFEVEGANLTLQPDLTCLLSDENLLSYTEVYSPLMNKIGRDKVALFKYPTLGVSEFLVAQVVGYDEMMTRIDNLEKTSERGKEILRSMFGTMSNGAIMVSNNNLLKHHLAGLDFDYDGVCVVSEVSLVKLFEEIQVVNGIKIVNIVHDKGDEGAASEVVISSETRALIFSKQLNNKDLNVGRVTNINSSVVALMATLEDNDGLARTILSKAFGSESTIKGNVAYKPLATENQVIDRVNGVVTHASITTVSEEGIGFFEKQLQEFDFFAASVDMIKEILIDLNHIGRFYQESVIDQDKDLSKVVNIRDFYKKLEKTAKSILVSDREICFNWDSLKLELLDNDKSEKILIESDLSKLLDKNMGDFMNKFNNELKEMDPVLDHVFERDAQSEFAKLDHNLGRALEKLVVDYNELRASRREALQRLDGLDEDSSIYEVKKIEERYERMFASLGNNFYCLTEKLNIRSKSLVAIYLSLGGGRNNSFARVVLPELYLLGMIEIQTIVDGGNYSAKGCTGIFNRGLGVYDGMKSFLINGKCEDGYFTTGSKFNGFVEVRGREVIVDVLETLTSRVLNRVDNGERFLSAKPLTVDKSVYNRELAKMISVLKQDEDRIICGRALNAENGDMIGRLQSFTNSLNEIELFNGSRIKIEYVQGLKSLNAGRGHSAAIIALSSVQETIELDIEFVTDSEDKKIETPVFEASDLNFEAIDMVEEEETLCFMEGTFEELLTVEQMRNKLNEEAQELQAKIEEAIQLEESLVSMSSIPGIDEGRKEKIEQGIKEAQATKKSLDEDLERILSRIAELGK